MVHRWVLRRLKTLPFVSVGGHREAAARFRGFWRIRVNFPVGGCLKRGKYLHVYRMLALTHRECQNFCVSPLKRQNRKTSSIGARCLMKGRSAPHRSDIAGPVWRNLKICLSLKENEYGVP